MKKAVGTKTMSQISDFFLINVTGGKDKDKDKDKPERRIILAPPCPPVCR